MNRSLLLIFSAAVVLGHAGCVTGQRSITLTIPKGARPLTKGQVAISSVSDDRRFANKPADPSTPSIQGDVNTLSADRRGRSIGRQRNTYGMAMGDITLAGGTVPDKMRELVAEAFARRGYSTSSGRSGGNSVDLTIHEFWAWCSPGMFSLPFEARIAGKFTVRRGGRSSTFTVQGHGLNQGQMASDQNWQRAYEEAFNDFLGKLTNQLAGAGF